MNCPLTGEVFPKDPFALKHAILHLRRDGIDNCSVAAAQCAGPRANGVLLPSESCWPLPISKEYEALHCRQGALPISPPRGGDGVIE